jgi:hypothetical protein
MADVAVVISEPDEDNGSTKVATWSPLTSTNLTGSPIKFNPWGDRTVQILGIFDTTTVTMQGSNDGGATWFTLNDVANTEISVTAAGGFAIEQVPLLIRPLIAGGAGSSITVIVAMRRSNQSRQ